MIRYFSLLLIIISIVGCNEPGIKETAFGFDWSMTKDQAEQKYGKSRSKSSFDIIITQNAPQGNVDVKDYNLVYIDSVLHGVLVEIKINDKGKAQADYDKLVNDFYKMYNNKITNDEFYKQCNQFNSCLSTSSYRKEGFDLNIGLAKLGSSYVVFVSNLRTGTEQKIKENKSKK